MGSGGGEVAARPRTAVALDFTASEASEARIPRRIRRRLMESSSRSGGPASVEEIEAKLRDADLRRQQFHDWLASKARPKPRSPSWSSHEEDLGQRLEAKLVAAEQKRLSLLANAQMRLAKLDELRQAAKNCVEQRVEKEREELGTKVEFRVKQAEANRLRLLKAHMQRRAAAKERTATSLSQRIIRENKYKECIRSAISEKRAAAEKKRLRLLEAEKRRVHDKVVQASKVAKNVCHQREIEQRKLKEQLEERLQRAKRQRTEYLKQRGSPRSFARVNVIKQGDLLSRKLARCWRRFVKSRSTTFTLAKAYQSLGINEKSVMKMPFEELAFLIESKKTIETTKALLDRLETCFLVLLSSGPSTMKNIDHLLKRLGSPSRRASSGRTTRNKGPARKTPNSKGSGQNKLSRYPVRIVLCAYMILGHPSAVFSGQGEREVSLRDSAVRFIQELEKLIKVTLDGSSSTDSSKKPTSAVSVSKDSPINLSDKWTFRGQLAAFDTAWCSYLYHFVAWKVKDARSLEDDLVRVACQLELSMMQTCKMSSEGQTSNLTHDMKAIQKQVIDDQKLLKEKVLHLSGDAGIERMECALADARSKFFEAKESGTPLASHVTHISTPSTSDSWQQPLAQKRVEEDQKPTPVSRSLFGAGPSTPTGSVEKSKSVEVQQSAVSELKPPTENELMVNEILHQVHGTFADTVDVDADNQSGLRVKIKEAMEKAFWDEVMNSMKEGEPDYGRIISLVKEVRDELCELAPQSWKQDIVSSIDLDILTQVVQSGSLDMDFFKQVLEYSLSILQKLSAPASENEMKRAHEKLFQDLTSAAQANQDNSFVIVTVKGLRFVLEEIQKLKKEVSKARIQLIEPIVKGSAGLEYLQKAFSDRYGAPSDVANSLPITHQWLSSLRNNAEEEWSEHMDFLSSVPSNNGLPPSALRTGGSLSAAAKQRDLSLNGSDELPGCSGEKVDKLVRLGLLKLASAIEGCTAETVPETMKLNVLRLRSVQSQFQQIIVAATSALVLRQILLSENSSASSVELQNAVTNTVSRLYDLFDQAPDAGIEEIIEVMMKSSSSYSSQSSEAKLQTRKAMLTRVLTKSLQNGDAVFGKVFRSIYLATRGLLLAGTAALGQKLADAALKRVGATMLLDRVVKMAEVLLIMASVTTHVHGPWYRAIVNI